MMLLTIHQIQKKINVRFYEVAGLKKETPTQVFSCEFGKKFKNTSRKMNIIL